MFKKAATSISNKFFAGLIILLSSNSFAAWDDLNMTEGVTAISKEVFELHMLIFWICVAIGLVVFSVMFYSMFAYTKKEILIPLHSMRIPNLSLLGRLYLS